MHMPYPVKKICPSDQKYIQFTSEEKLLAFFALGKKIQSSLILKKYIRQFPQFPLTRERKSNIAPKLAKIVKTEITFEIPSARPTAVYGINHGNWVKVYQNTIVIV